MQSVLQQRPKNIPKLGTTLPKPRWLGESFGSLFLNIKLCIWSFGKTIFCSSRVHFIRASWTSKETTTVLMQYCCNCLHFVPSDMSNSKEVPLTLTFGQNWHYHWQCKLRKLPSKILHVILEKLKLLLLSISLHSHWFTFNWQKMSVFMRNIWIKLIFLVEAILPLPLKVQCSKIEIVIAIDYAS